MGDHKVLFLHKSFSVDGGVERVHKNLSTALKEQGIESIFYVHNIQGRSEQGFAKLKQSFTAYAAGENLSLARKLLFLFSLINRKKISVIIAATETANMLALLCKLRFPKLKIVFTRHCAFDVSDQKLPPWAIKALYTAYSAIGGNIVAVSDQLREEIASTVLFKKRKVSFIPNAVIQPSIATMAEHTPSIPLPSSYLCSVGRLVEQKGFDLLLDAYKKALDERPTLPDLVIVGEGDDRVELEALAHRLKISEKVHLPGFNDNPYSIIKRAEAFILSSRHEGMPTVLVESIFLDTPVIAFDCPTGPRELITSEKVGVLVPKENTDELAKAIVQYDKVRNFNNNISQYVNNFSYENVAKAYISKFS